MKKSVLAASVLACAMGQARAQADVVVSLHAGRHEIGVVRRGNAEHVVTVDGHPVIDDRSDQYVLLVGPFGGDGASYVLVAESPGGNACPAHFQALDVSAAQVRVSAAFGNCNDQPRVSVVKGELDVVTPAFKQSPAAHVTFDGAHGLRP